MYISISKKDAQKIYENGHSVYYLKNGNYYEVDYFKDNYFFFTKISSSEKNNIIIKLFKLDLITLISCIVFILSVLMFIKSNYNSDFYIISGLISLYPCYNYNRFISNNYFYQYYEFLIDEFIEKKLKIV